ncbi:LOW QUALITY PROTEIN: RING finger protein 225, partial [Oxyura jamaicensis]|uniref:LOW QUALITY PROTEIN: RING finger protein 225 n=1 Tax=Oxyura jamaicensis TaxID=8884 RepID=UPI0015A5CED5
PTVYHLSRDVAATQSPPEDPEGPPQDCEICFAPCDRFFKLPKALACGHVFCPKCLARVSVAAPAAPLLCPTAVLPHCGPPALTSCPLTSLPPPVVSSASIAPRGSCSTSPPSRPGAHGPSAWRWGGLSPPPAPPGGRSGVWWPLFEAVAITIALMVAGGLVLCGIILFFLLPAVCEGGGQAEEVARYTYE